jgi:spermidine synthase
VVWVRLLTEVFGVTAYAVTTVLATFLGGLALGGIVLGRLADRAADPLRFYGWLEVGIGVAGVLGTATVGALEPLHVRAASRLASDSAALVAVRVLLAMPVILPPTFLMGGTLPAMTRVVVDRIQRLGRELAFLYALNTLGAVAGTLAAGFVLIRWIGLHPTLWTAAALNLGVGAASLALARRAGATASTTRAPASAVAGVPEGGVALLVVMAVSGFAALGLEVVWTRVLVLAVGTTTYAFVTMLASFLVGIALGSILARLLADRVGDVRRTFGWLQLGIGTATLATLPVLRRINTGTTERWLDVLGSDWLALVAGRFGVGFAVMLVPTTLMGMAFPLAARLWAREVPSLATRLGQVYGANTAGNIVGAAVSGFVLLPAVGLQRSIAVLAILYLATAAWGLAPARWSRRGLAVGLPLAVVLLGAGAVAAWHPGPFETEERRQAERLLFYREGVSSVVSVYEDRFNRRQRSMLVDGVTIGTSYRGVDEKQQVLAHFPFLLLPATPPRRLLSIGLGTGILAGEVARHGSVESMDCVEIEPAVIEGAHLFESFNGRVLDDPKVRVVADDGVNFLRRSRDRYDAVIADEKSRTGHAGNGVFFTTDYYGLCRDHLAPGGLMIQWVPLDIPPAELAVILRSFVQVFPHAYLWVVPPLSGFLVGSHEPLVLDAGHLERALAEPAFAHLRRYGWRDASGFVGLLTADRPALTRWLPSDGPVNTLERPLLEFYSPREHAAAPAARIADNLTALARARATPPDDLQLRGVDPGALGSAAETRLLEASALLARGGPDDTKGLVFLGEAVAAAPTHGPLLYAAARAYVGAGQAAQARGALDRALVFYRGAVRSDPELVEAQGSLGSALILREDLDPAMAHYGEAVRLNPDDARVHYGLGVALALSGRLAEAVPHFEQAVHINPGYSEAKDALSKARAGAHRAR